MGALLSLVRQHRATLEQRVAAADLFDDEALELENSLSAFVEAAWPSIDASRYVRGWCVDALCEHLTSVTKGEISRLLINYPPRASKTTVTSIAWPAWTWARRERSFRSGDGVRFLCASYGHRLSVDNSAMHRRLILSPWYCERWGHRFSIQDDQNSKIRFDLTTGGSRIATSVGGILLGVGGDINILDDPHNTSDVESEAERENTLQWWSEFSTTRLNDPKNSAMVVIMQRLAENDISGHILENNADGEWTTLVIPMEFESRRFYINSIGWADPRGLGDDGEPLIVDGFPRDDEAARIVERRENSLMWEARFDRKAVEALKTGLGPYFASGRLQQAPAPKGGGIFQRDWWQLWESPNGKLPPCEYIIASLDGAFTEDEENDPSALTVWGVFTDPETKRRRIILMDAWRKHLKFSGPRIDRLTEPAIIDGQRWPVDAVLPGMAPEMVKFRNDLYRRRSQKSWGLIEHVADSCRRREVDLLLIEAKASGISAAQELRNRYGQERWGIQLVPVKGDKVARAYAAVPTFSQNMIFAPDRDWAQMVIDEMAVFPKGKHDDLTDSATQAVNYLRSIGMAQSDDEARDLEVRAAMPRRRSIDPVARYMAPWQER